MAKSPGRRPAKSSFGANPYPPMRRTVKQWRKVFYSLHIEALWPGPWIEAGTNLWLRPDFYLPASRQIVLVGDNPDFADEALFAAAFTIADAMNRLGAEDFGGPAAGPDHLTHDVPIVLVTMEDAMLGLVRYGFENGPISLGLYQCPACRGWWFGDPTALLVCQCCRVECTSPLVSIASPLKGMPVGRPS